MISLLCIITICLLFISHDIRMLSSVSIIYTINILTKYQNELSNLKKDNCLITLFNLIFKNYESIYVLISLITIYSYFLNSHILNDTNDRLRFDQRSYSSTIIIFTTTFAIIEPLEINKIIKHYKIEEINESLINPMMIVHPILLYAAYSLILTLALYFLKFKKLSSAKRFYLELRTNLSKIITLLGSSLLFSILWSWDINSLSWTWDPIEGLLMFIFILSVLIIHILYFNRSYNDLLPIQNKLFNLFWISPIISLILVRQAMLESIHSFSEAENFYFLYFILYILILYYIKCSNVTIRRFYIISTQSLIILCTYTIFIIALLIFSLHAIYPNILGFSLESDDFERYALLPIVISTSAFLIIKPILKYPREIIGYIYIISTIYIYSLYNHELSNIAYSAIATSYAYSSYNSFKFKNIHSIITALCLTIIIIITINHEEEISIIVGQSIKNKEYNLILYKLETYGEGKYNQEISQILYENKIINNKIKNIEINIKNNQNNKISKERIYNTILGKSEQTIKYIKNNQTQFINIKEEHTAHTISTICLYTLNKTKEK